MAQRLLRLFLVTAIGVLFIVGVRPALAEESFYKGKTIHIIVGFAAGGGYDAYARVIGRHMGKYIPGNPSIVVENMAGAGSLIAANHIYKAAKPDGLAFAHFSGGLFFQELLGQQGIQFESRRFEHIGAPFQDNFMMGFSKASGITSMEKWIASKTPVKIGGQAPGAANEDLPKILKAILGLPIQLVSGYKGSADIRLAVNGGEVAGICNAWESFKSTWRKELESEEVVIVLQLIPKAHPDLPNVPLAINYAKTDEARKLIQVAVHDYGTLARPFVLPPGTPKDRLQILRKAFLDTLNDPEFQAEAKKAQLDINPVPGEELGKIVNNVFKLDPALVAKWKQALSAK
jgi:tripartite-type tricarboxylate transporter receptor subunit TctC